jgi:hypothetical protein
MVLWSYSKVVLEAVGLGYAQRTCAHARYLVAAGQARHALPALSSTMNLHRRCIPGPLFFLLKKSWGSGIPAIKCRLLMRDKD